MKKLLMGVVSPPQQEIEQLYKCKSAILGDDRADTLPNVDKTLGRQNAHRVAHNRPGQAKLFSHIAFRRKRLTDSPVSGYDQLLQSTGQFPVEALALELNDGFSHSDPLSPKVNPNRMGIALRGREIRQDPISMS